MLKQLTVFLENRKGSLVELTDLLAEENIDILTFTIADTESFGLMRMIVSDPARAKEVLVKNKFSADLTDVIGVEVPARPGELNKLIKKIDHFQIDYLYVFSNREDKSGIILRIKEGEEAENFIVKAGYDLIGDYKL